jgi:hypothetical protein
MRVNSHHPYTARQNVGGEAAVSPLAATSLATTRTDVMRVSMSSDQARAEALFKKEARLREGEKAMAEYEADQQRMRENIVRLRALRLARDAAPKQNGPSKEAGELSHGGHLKGQR